MKRIILTLVLLIGSAAAQAGTYIPHLGQGDPCGIIGGAAEAIPRPGGVLCTEDPNANLRFDELVTGTVPEEYGDYIPYLGGFGDPYGLTLSN
jgi:hypothetical protein